MSCSCRTSVLRSFVRSIAQIHFPETTLGRAAWRSQRPLTRLSREGLLSELPVTTWSRTFHSTIINHEQSRSEAPPHRSDEIEQRQEKNARAHSQTNAAIAELSHDALDVLAAEINAAEASKDHNSIPKTSPSGKRPDRGAIRRLNISEGSFRKPRDRSMQLKQPWNKKERNTADNDQPYKKEDWQIQKAALKEKFPEGWQPRKKLSPDALAGIRALHEQFPEDYTTEVLADKFEVSPEAIRRILKSKWEPSPEEEEKRQQRWFNRGKQVWSRWAELGKKPPTRWREEGIERKPYRGQRRYDEDEMEEEDDLSETGNNRLIARSKLAKNLM